MNRGVGICAASSVVNPVNLEKSLPRFARWALPVCVADQVHSTFRTFAGPDVQRAGALNNFARDPLIGTIWCARGGYGSTRLLPLLDEWNTAGALKKDPKLLIGFSDVTGLHLYFHKKLGLPTLHAPMPGSPAFAKLTPRVHKLLLQFLAGEVKLGKNSYTSDWVRNKKQVLLPPERDVEGVIIGGNLSLLATLVGTPWQPDLSGCFLFLEDCAEQPYRVDRMLTQLHNAGMLKNLRGVLLGDFEADVVYKEKIEKTYWTEIFRERFEPLGIPVLSGLPVGHGKKNDPLPLGVRAAITKQGKLLLLEQPVRA